MNEPIAPAPKPQFGLGALVSHPEFGVARVVDYEGEAYVLVFKGGQARRLAFSFAGLQPVQSAGDPETDRVKRAMREVLEEHGWIDAELELGSRWAGGRLELIPGKEGTQAKQVPIEDFFKKIVGLRDKLRVLEQKINSHPSLTPEEKLDLQGYITRGYGSLTTFNVLFADKESQFKGTGKAGE
jgi:hypothetical protein